MSDPYAKPEADLAGANSQATYQPKFLSTQGRIGRLRYLAYTTGASFLLSILAIIPIALIFVAAGVTVSSFAKGEMGIAVTIIAILVSAVLYIAAIAIGFIYTKRRLNDLGQTGWLSLLLFLPIVNIILGIYILFFRGNAQSNQYGAKPVPNSAGVIILASLVILLYLLSIAAISIPAYQGYTLQSEQAQSQLQE